MNYKHEVLEISTSQLNYFRMNHYELVRLTTFRYLCF